MKEVSEDNLPVRILSRRLVVENTRWKVLFDHIQAENGHEVLGYLVVQPKVSLEGNVTGVGVLPVLDDKVILRKSYRYPLEDYFWEIPRGLVEEGDDPEISALRELEEEAGLICDKDDLHFLCNVAPEASTLAAKVAICLATNCRPGGVRDLEEPGLGDCHAFTRDEIRSMIASNEVCEGNTQVALCRYLLDVPPA